MADADDWRLTGQAKYLQGAALTWKAYHAPRETWDHDHCSFCWATFSDKEPGALTAGYATMAEHEHGADYHWVCKQCFEDFNDLFAWRVAQSNAS
jgi:hypothetical protein